MTERKIKWTQIAANKEVLPWQDNHMCIVELGEKTITLVQNEGILYACAHKCPHAGGIMANGFLDAKGDLVCPLHRYRFSLKNGRNTSGEGYYLKVYLIEEREDGIYIGEEDKGFFGWMGI